MTRLTFSGARALWAMESGYIIDEELGSIAVGERIRSPFTLSPCPGGVFEDTSSSEEPGVADIWRFILDIELLEGGGPPLAKTNSELVLFHSVLVLSYHLQALTAPTDLSKRVLTTISAAKVASLDFVICNKSESL